jgi:hypothetical protein
MRARSPGLALALGLLIAPPGAPAQPPKDDPSVLSSPILGPEPFSITRVDRDGTIVLGPSDMIQPLFRDLLATSVAEGYYVLVTTEGRPTGQRRVFRVRVDQIAEDAVVTLKTGREAAARVRVGNGARLFRPSHATTARLRALPDEIPLRGDPAVPAPPDDVLERVLAGRLFELGRLNVPAPRDDVLERVALARSTNNLKLIGLALHIYHSVYDQFPPAVIHGPDGKPWHSWRVLILPFLEGETDTFNAYDFGQPWDSLRNKPLIDRMPAVYHDPSHGDAKGPYTGYAALVGPKAIFRPEGARESDPKNPPIGKGGLGVHNVTDGTSYTVMVAPVDPGRKIPWTKPEDIDVGPGFSGFGKPGGIAASYRFHGKEGGKAAPFLFADGSVHVIGAAIKPSVLEALITCAAGEVIAPEAYPSESNPADESNLAGALTKYKTLKIRLDGGKATATIE